ncbi:4'-phosphopantetheinyl transferase superfamily protein [Kribbella sp. NPDC050820]|uniref:4'-phosphopantetheinyl transferase family protein n=1 Tax=Kribbella sp. NPDC050820 TaxID=3155408 RepID=UPI003411EABD
MTEVEVWWGRIGQVREEFAAELDPFERQRHQAYVRPEDKARFLLGCTIVRRVLASRLALPPASISLDRTCPNCGKPHGKVRADGVELSVTHSGELVGVAVSERPVGLDVEKVDPAIDIDGLARLSLAEAEIAQLVTAADKPRAFLRQWTRKEAIVKATGAGLREDLRTITGVPEGMQVIELPVDPGYSAALAVVSAEPPAIQTKSAQVLI